MNDSFSLIPNAIAQQLAVTEIIRCNQTTSRYGLVLSGTEAAELALTRSEVLEKLGRIEFSGGIISRLIMEFCDSPYLSQANYAETLHDLIETFYYFKNETMEDLDDDELISLMKKSFDWSCNGSVELLQIRDMEILARKMRHGIDNQDDLREELEGVFEEDYGREYTEDRLIVEEDFDYFEVGTLDAYKDLFRYYRKR